MEQNNPAKRSGEIKMRVTRYSFLLIVGLMLTIGISTAFASADDSGKKRPKDAGTLSIRTTEEAFPVKIGGILSYTGHSYGRGFRAKRKDMEESDRDKTRPETLCLS